MSKCFDLFGKKKKDLTKEELSKYNRIIKGQNKSPRTLILENYFNGKRYENLNSEEIFKFNSIVKERKKAYDRQKKRKERIQNPEKQRKRLKKCYEKRRDYYVAKSALNKDKRNSERIINRMLKCIDAESISTRELGDRVNEAIELCVAEINKSFTGKNS